MRTRFFLIILFGAAARVFLVLNLAIQFRPYEVHGDGLYMRLASYVASGAWLGEFNQFTFLKEPGYVFFLAVSNLSGLPLSTAAHALRSSKQRRYRRRRGPSTVLTRSQWGAVAVFFALAFCPMGLVLHRCYRTRSIGRKHFWSFHCS